MAIVSDKWLIRVGARWIARANAVQGLVRMGMLILTGLSTAVVALQSYGHGRWAWHLIAVVGFGTVVFTYIYTEGGIYNQQKRDLADFGNNYTDPRMRIAHELHATAMFAALNERPPTKNEQEYLSDAINDVWATYRDGIDIEDHYQQSRSYSDD